MVTSAACTPGIESDFGHHLLTEALGRVDGAESEPRAEQALLAQVRGAHPVAEMAGDGADGEEDEASDHHGDGVHLRMSEHGRHEHDRECERSNDDAASLTELECHEHDRHDGEEREPEGRVIREDHGREDGDEEDRRAAEQQRAPLRPATHQEAERSG